MYLVLVVICLTLGCLHWIWSSTYWSRRGIYGPMGMPIFGNMFYYLIGKRHYGYVYEDIYKSFPEASYVGFYRVLNEPAILLRHLDMIKEIMIKSFSSFHDNVLYVDEKQDAIIMCDPFVARGEQWRVMRSEIVPIFTPNKVKLSFPHVIATCKKLDNFITKNIIGQCFEAKGLCSRYTIDVVASAACGIDGGSLSDTKSELTQLIENLFMPNPFSLLETTALLFLPRLGKLINFRYIPNSLQDWLMNVTKRIVMQKRDSTGLKTNYNDFIQWLIEAKQRANEPIDEFTIVGHCSTFFLEGFETSAALMSFALYEFAVNSHIQDEVQKEIDDVLKRHNGQISYEAILELTYLESALYETLRLHPPMLALLKQCTKPFKLGSQFEDIALKEDVTVKKGTVFVVPVKAIHYDENLFPNPHKYNPDRFSEENKHSRDHCAFLGFGEGPRMCPGNRFGLAQSKAGLATILSKYRVELSQRCVPLEIAPTTFLTSTRKGIWLKLKPRM